MLVEKVRQRQVRKPPKIKRRLRPEDFTAPLYIVIMDAGVELTVRVLLETHCKVLQLRILRRGVLAAWALFDRKEGGEPVREGQLFVTTPYTHVREGDTLTIQLCDL
jgi:hypothetical protein